MRNLTRKLGLAAAVLGLMIGAEGRAHAGMVLTAAGIAEGFSLSTFATGFVNSGTNGSARWGSRSRPVGASW